MEGKKVKRQRPRSVRQPSFALRALTLNLTLLLGAALGASAQIAESPQDPTGVSVLYPLVHLVHSTDAGQSGTTADFSRRDPFLLYQLGRDLLNRSFLLRQGAYGKAAELSVPLYREDPDGKVYGPLARLARDHTASCGFCHAIPYREPGGGQTIGSTSATGRNSPHFYGAGLVEMLAEQIRQKILLQYDTNHNGVIDRAELVGGPKPVRLAPTSDAPAVDYGDLTPGPDGVPQLNNLFRIWYLDAAGRVLPDAYGLDDPRVASFNFAAELFGWGRGRHRIGTHQVSEGAEAATIRGFYTAASDTHMGLQAYDPTQADQGQGVGRRSLAGALQYAALGNVNDHGKHLSAKGLSLDDPDGDGHVNELTEGDVDAVEFYMLHAPAPAVMATPESERGRAVLRDTGCVRCHVENWQIEARDPAKGFTGDRRLFELKTTSRTTADGTIELTGRLVPLYRRLPNGAYEPVGGAAPVERIYSDFKHWDLGPQFYERRFDGTLQREHRTAPLWGVGTTAPYGHTGQFLTLDAVISAHDGAAAKEAAAYRALDPERKRQLLDYLDSLVLYSTDTIPSDIDGDGTIREHFEVGGVDVGYERFDARFLLATPPRYKKLKTVTDPYGRQRSLLLVENAKEAFGLDLPYRRDADGNGFPDVIAPSPGAKENANAKKAH
ncbi:MAG TPA: di-heme oxidoredictase family protein [Thermoanaerobaculia bacterium]|nr:di-heme oxidoredictase family protein [Thermoanaerobaculia bacterium]